MSGGDRRRAWAVFALGGLAIAGALWPPDFRVTDHFIFWYVGRLNLTGGNPYDVAAWMDAQRTYGNDTVDLILGLIATSGGRIWAYPPWTGYLFVPFGAFPSEAGMWLLHLAYIAALVGASALLVGLFRWRSWTALALALLVAISSQSFIYAIRLGHFGTFVLLGVVLAIRGLVHGSRWQLVVGALLVSAKPEIALVFVAAVAVLLARAKRWGDVASIVGAFVLVAGVSTALHPDGLSELLLGSRERAVALIGPGTLNPVPNAWTIAAMAVGAAWPVVGALVVLFALALWAFAVRSAGAASRTVVLLAGALAISVFATPYVYSYDHVLLVPAAFAAFAAADALHGGPRTAHLVATLLIALIVPWLAFFVASGTGDHGILGFVPLFFAVLLIPTARASALPRASVAA